MAKKVEIEKADGTKATVDTTNLGVRRQTFVHGVTSPAEVIDQTDEMKRFERRLVTADIAFSDISYSEAVQLGKQPWRFFKRGSNGKALNYTAVVDGRRFLVDIETYEKLLGDGLVG